MLQLQRISDSRADYLSRVRGGKQVNLSAFLNNNDPVVIVDQNQEPGLMNQLIRDAVRSPVFPKVHSGGGFLFPVL